MSHGRPRGTHTEASIYAAIKAFVLAEHRLPSVRDYEARAYGLPSNSSTVYRHCSSQRMKALLAKDGISYTGYTHAPVSSTHPWLQGKHCTPPVFLEE